MLSMAGRYRRAKERAAKRNLEFALTREEFEAITIRPCHYCGSTTRPSRGSGIDRVDNLKGYTVQNSVPACTLCNTVKGSVFTEWQMLQIGRLIATFTLEPMWRNA